MNAIQALMDKGWTLTVRKHAELLPGRPYVADIAAGGEPQIGQTFGHSHSGKTLAEALECLEAYVAAEGKGASRE